MPYLLVLVVAAAVGAAAFRATMRQTAAPAAAPRHRIGQPVGIPVPSPSPSAGPTQRYVPVTDYSSSWESRLTGALGLVIAVIVGAASLAIGAYLGGVFIVKLIHRSVG